MNISMGEIGSAAVLLGIGGAAGAGVATMQHHATEAAGAKWDAAEAGATPVERAAHEKFAGPRPTNSFGQDAAVGLLGVGLMAIGGYGLLAGRGGGWVGSMASITGGMAALLGGGLAAGAVAGAWLANRQ